jgi:membrane fusion protein (multidrug efflux system)
MYRKQEWESPSRLVSQDQTPAVQALEDQGPKPHLEAVPLQPAAEAPLPTRPNPVEAARDGAKQPQRYSRRRLALGTAVVLAIGAASWFGYDWWMVGRFTVSTDDAYVGAYNTTLATKVSGYIANVAVTDNARVNAGDIIATLDDGDYRLAAQSARDKVATQQATIARIGHQIGAQQAAVE